MDNKKLISLQWCIIIVFFVLIVLFIIQNLNLKNSISLKTKVNTSLNSQSFEYKLKEYFLFKKLPIKIELEDFYFFEKHKMGHIDGYIIMVFDLTVCGKCLHDELKLLHTFREKADDKNIFFTAIIGTTDKREDSEIINLYRTGSIFFPFKLINIDDLYDIFKLDKENFIDTPFYMYTTHTYKILDIFKPQYLETKEFYRWLSIITNQDY